MKRSFFGAGLSLVVGLIGCGRSGPPAGTATNVQSAFKATRSDIREFADQGVEITNMETGEPLSEVRDKVQSANVYLGAAGLVEALDKTLGCPMVTQRATPRKLASISNSYLEVIRLASRAARQRPAH